MSSSGSKPVRHNYPNDEVFEAAMMEYLQATKQVSRPRLLFTQEEIENKNLLFEEWGFSQSFEEPRLPKAVVAAKAEEQPVVTVEEAKKNPLEAMRRLIGLGPDAEKGQRGIEKRRQQMLEMKRRRQQHELEASYHYIPPDEQVIFGHDLIKGLLVEIITTKGVRRNGQMVVDFATIDDLTIGNRHSRSQGNFVSYGNHVVRMGHGRGRSRSFGDILFWRQGNIVYTFVQVSDPSGVVSSIKAAIKGRGY